MLITIIGFSILAIGIILGIIRKFARKKHNWAVNKALDLPSFAFTLLGIVAAFFITIFLLCNFATYNLEYENKLYEREVLEYRLESVDNNITGNELLYNDIVAFNNTLRFAKKYANNPWLSWFNNQKIASIDYIELPIGE